VHQTCSVVAAFIQSKSLLYNIERALVTQVSVAFAFSNKKSSEALETAHTNGCLSTGLRSAAVVPPTIEARHTAEARRGLRVVHNTVGMCLITGVRGFARGFARRSLCTGSRMDLGVEAWGPLCTGHVSQCLCERSRSRSGVHSIAGVRGLRSNEERRSLWSGSRDRSWCGGLGPAVHWLCSHPGPQPALSSSSRCIGEAAAEAGATLCRRHL
jgi:hypothetical protein